MFHLL